MAVTPEHPLPPATPRLGIANLCTIGYHPGCTDASLIGTPIEIAGSYLSWRVGFRVCIMDLRRTWKCASDRPSAAHFSLTRLSKQMFVRPPYEKLTKYNTNNRMVFPNGRVITLLCLSPSPPLALSPSLPLSLHALTHLGDTAAR